jgi:hypothetical protein
VDSFEHKTSLLSSSTQEAPSEDRTGGHDDRDDRLHAGDFMTASRPQGPLHDVKGGNGGCLPLLKLTLNTTDSKMSFQ